MSTCSICNDETGQCDHLRERVQDRGFHVKFEPAAVVGFADLHPSVCAAAELLNKLEAQAERLLADQTVKLFDAHDREVKLAYAVAIIAFWCEDPFEAVNDLVAELKEDLPKRFPAWRGYGLEFTS